MTMDLETVDRVVLSRSPLILVLAQIRYSSSPELVEDVQEQQLARLLPSMPVRRTKDVIQIPMPQFPEQQRSVRERVFQSLDNQWTLTVTPDFVALQVSVYPGRDSFIGKLEEVLAAVKEVHTPPLVQRIGVRYIDRVDVREGVETMIRKELRAGMGEFSGDVRLVSQSTQIELQKPPDAVLMRSLVLPPNALYDPMVAPCDKTAWFLDIDAFSMTPCEFVAGPLAATVDRLADRVYSAFRWAVADNFLDSFK
jgi:uncharacterized protein (TIGR04255 family)